MNVPNQNNPQQNNQDQENHNLALKINTQLNTFDLNNPKGLVKQSLKNCLGLNFNNFNNTYTRNILNFGPEKIYFLTHNLRTNFEKDKKVPSPFDDLISKYNAAKFEQISNNFLSREKDYYKEFVEINGNIGINNLNNIHNITSELRKINANNLRFIKPSSDFKNVSKFILSILSISMLEYSFLFFAKLSNSPSNPLSSLYLMYPQLISYKVVLLGDK